MDMYMTASTKKFMELTSFATGVSKFLCPLVPSKLQPFSSTSYTETRLAGEGKDSQPTSSYAGKIAAMHSIISHKAWSHTHRLLLPVCSHSRDSVTKCRGRSSKCGIPTAHPACHVVGQPLLVRVWALGETEHVFSSTLPLAYDRY